MPALGVLGLDADGDGFEFVGQGKFADLLDRKGKLFCGLVDAKKGLVDGQFDFYIEKIGLIVGIQRGSFCASRHIQW